MKYLMHWSLAGLLFSTPASFGDMPLKGRPTPTGHTTTWMQAPATTSTVSATPSHQPVVPSAPPMESPRVIVREGPSRGETVIVPVGSVTAVPPTTATATVPAAGPGVNLDIKAASIEVAWLQQPATYPLRLRAVCQPGDAAITLTGYLPHEKLREKALAIARAQAGTIPLIDQLTVQPQMALPVEVPLDEEQVFLVKLALEQAQPGLSQQVDITVDAQGVIYLSGRVDELADRRKIIRALQGIPGCTAVRYSLSVPAAGQPAQTAAQRSASTNLVRHSPAHLSKPSGPASTPGNPQPAANTLQPVEARSTSSATETSSTDTSVTVPPLHVSPALVTKSAGPFPHVNQPKVHQPEQAPIIPLVPPLDLRLPGEMEPPNNATSEKEPATQKAITSSQLQEAHRTIEYAVEVPVEQMISQSSQSGLFPPGVTGFAPVLDTAGITLHSPIVAGVSVARLVPSTSVISSTAWTPTESPTPVNTAFSSASVITPVEATAVMPGGSASKIHVTRPISLSVFSQPVDEALPEEIEIIGVMPRRATLAPSRRVIP